MPDAAAFRPIGRLPQRFRPRALAIAGDALVAVGDGAGIARSADGGATWERIAAPSDATLRAVAFADAARGIAVGDGGTHPPPAHPPPPGFHLLLDLAAAVEAMNAPRPAGAAPVDLQALVARTPLPPVSTILLTVDGGRSWTRIAAPTNFPLTCAAWVDPRTVLVGSGDPTSPFPHDGDILASHDGGRTWSVALGAYRPLTGLAAGGDAVLAVGHDQPPPKRAGDEQEPRRSRTFGDRSLLAGGPANAIDAAFVTDADCWMATPLRIGHGRIDDVCITAFGGAVRAWVVGADGLIATAARSGPRWTGWRVSRLDGAGRLRSVRFRDDRVGLIVGDRGAHLTDDGGERWRASPFGADPVGADWVGDGAVAIDADGSVFALR